jgi:hypothetical protein
MAAAESSSGLLVRFSWVVQGFLDMQMGCERVVFSLRACKTIMRLLPAGS